MSDQKATLSSASDAGFWEANARGRSKWWDKFEESFQVVSDRLVELAGIGPGDKVLDVGTGTGEPAFTAARRVGPSGRVVGTDISPAMLALARQKAGHLRLDGNVEFHVVDAQALDFQEATFDAALCRFVLMFLPDVNSALERIRGLLRPGRKFAAAVLGPPDRTPSVTIWQRALAKEHEAQGGDQDSSEAVTGKGINPFRFGDLDALAAAVRNAGFEHVETESVRIIQSFRSADEFLNYQLDMDPSLKERTSVTAMSRIFETARRGLEPFTDSQGRVRFPGQHNLVVGRSQPLS